LAITDCVRQDVHDQLDRDAKIVKLVYVMEDMYTFVNVVKAFPAKAKVLEDVIMSILMQTVECMVFIREYSRHGFGGGYYMLLSFPHLFMRDRRSTLHTNPLTQGRDNDTILRKIPKSPAGVLFLC
jgi:hypothetical protein